MAVTSIYSNAILAAFEEITALLLIDRPEIPADLPTTNFPAAASILKGIIEGGIVPVLSDLEQNLSIVNESISEWQKYIGNVRINERLARSQELVDFKDANHSNDVIRNSRAFIRIWKQHKANLEVRLAAF